MLLVVASVALIVSVTTMTSKDRLYFNKAAPLVLVVFGLPCIWLMVQRVPLPWLANPVWTSVQTGIENPLPGYISVDLSATSFELGTCLLGATVFLAATAIGIAREDAQWLLPGLVLVTTAFGGAVTLGLDGLAASIGVPVDVAALTLLLAASEGLNVVERLQAGSRRANATVRVVLISASSVIAVMACVFEMGWRNAAAGLYLLAGGLGTLMVLYTIRRLRLGAVSAATALLVLAGLVGAFLAEVQVVHGSPFLAFASSAPSSIERTERMIADAPRVGIGGGAFASIEGLYRGIREPRLEAAPTFAAKEAVELGFVPMMIEGVGLLAVFAMLVKTAVDRTRDWIYAAAGAAALVELGVASLLNAGPGNLTLQLLASAVLGLAAAQQSSRKTHG